MFVGTIYSHETCLHNIILPSIPWVQRFFVFLLVAKCYLSAVLRHAALIPVLLQNCALIHTPLSHKLVHVSILRE